jgi:pyruvate dehydrogenase E2 component (dihydrolipoamide acetyltransferase)
MAEFLMPSLGADMSAGTLVCFRKQVGEAVARGEILAEVETDKGLIEIECFVAGRLEKLLVEPGSKVPVGTALAIIADGAVLSATLEEPAAKPPAPPAPPAPPEVHKPAPPVIAAPIVEARAGESPALLHATPAARRILRERGIDASCVHPADPHGTITGFDLQALRSERAEIAASGRWPASPRARARAGALGITLAGVSASGPGGYVIAADVEAAARARSERAPAAPAASSEPSDAAARMRHAIAEATTRSKREIPHFYLAHTVPLRDTLAWLERENQAHPVDARILPVSLFVRAVAAAVRKVPELNGTYVDGRLIQSADVHITMAISLRAGGLVAPTLRDADKLSLAQASAELTELVESARASRLRSSQMTPGTIGITSLGERGVESVLPVIMPPQIAMVGFGAIAPTPCVLDGAVIACPAVVVSLAADHRLCDGHRGGLFLRAIARALQEVPA